MTREIQDIPPAPRKVRARAVLWHWWPVAFVGFVLGVYGGLITLMLVLASGGKPADDRLLDRTSLRAQAVVTRIEGGTDHAPIRPSYRFEIDGTERNSRAFLDDPALQVGATIPIEYAPGHPNINRPLGGRIAMVPQLHRFSMWFFFAGLLCIGTWFFAVIRLTRLMQFGDMSVARILAIEKVKTVAPLMLRVRYSFRNHRAEDLKRSHWVRARSALGQRVQAEPERTAVLHSRSGRGPSRLVLAEDFVVERASDDERVAPHP